jgi:hypothetical protein
LTLEILETEEISPTVDVMGELLRFKHWASIWPRMTWARATAA